MSPVNRTLGGVPSAGEEKSSLQELVESRGHNLLMSPKYHHELAGLGIEYSWRKSKLEYRRHSNDENPKNLQNNNLEALCVKTLLFPGRVRQFARKKRDYRPVYARLRDTKTYAQFAALHACNDGKSIQKMVALYRAHRNIKNRSYRDLLRSQ